MQNCNLPPINNIRLAQIMPTTKKLYTSRLILQRLCLIHANEYYNLYNKNYTYLSDWMPFVYYKLSISEVVNILKYQNKLTQQNQGLDLGIFIKVLPKLCSDKSSSSLKAKHNKLIGKITIQNIIFGPLCSAGIGYWIDRDFYSKGYTTEALARVIIFIFEELQLHRIWASVQPQNKASIRVLEKLGFVCEGMHRKEIYICNEWKDHLHYSLLDHEYFSNKLLYKRIINANNS